MTKILITGAAGTLAYSILENSKSEDISFYKTDKKNSDNINISGDLSDSNFINRLFNKYEPDIVLHLAAETDVDLCEINKKHAVNSNYVTTKNLVDYASEKNIPLVFTSTASIFPGKENSGYKEESKPQPANFYALTKLLAEQYIVQNTGKYLIIRLGWLIGNPKIDKKFIGTIFKFMMENKKEIFGVNDIWGSLSFADNLFPVLKSLLEEEKWGIYHFASSGNTNRHEIIKNILNVYNLYDSINLHSVKNSFFKTSSPRPKYELLSTEKLSSLEISFIDSWENDLSIFLDKYKHLLRK